MTLNSQPQRLLLVKPSSFGDIVNALPALAAFKARWPDAEIDWAVKREWAGLLTGHPMLRRVVYFPVTAAEGLSSWHEVSRESYDLVIDLQGLLRSALYAALTRCSVRVGFADGREGSPWFYTHRIRVSDGAVHAVDRHLDLARQLGAASQSACFPLPDGEREKVWLDALWQEAGLGRGETVCVIHPSARRETKRWPAERFAQLAEEVSAQQGWRVILVGAESPVSPIAEAPGRMRTPALNLLGKTSLLQLAALLRRADLLVTSDSGPMHLAAAVGTPVVAVFGPTDPRRVGPYGEGHAVLQKDIDCSRCRRHACVRDQLCMKAVTVDEVRNAALAVAGSARRQVNERG
jgi:lipopolysaccharide heptosyltransferase I